MEFQDYENFVKGNHRGVITTYRRNGAGHGSIVVCGAYQGKAAFVIVRGNSVKVGNLRRDNRCTVMAVSEDWRSCAAVEGTSTLMDYTTPTPKQCASNCARSSAPVATKTTPIGKSTTWRWCSRTP